MTKNEILQLSEEIKLQRFKRKKSQEDCAKYLNISIPTYRELEYNPNKLNLEQSIGLSELLEWNIFDFFLKNVLQNAIKQNDESKTEKE